MGSAEVLIFLYFVLLISQIYFKGETSSSTSTPSPPLSEGGPLIPDTVFSPSENAKSDQEEQNPDNDTDKSEKTSLSGMNSSEESDSGGDDITMENNDDILTKEEREHQRIMSSKLKVCSISIYIS